MSKYAAPVGCSFDGQPAVALDPLGRLLRHNHDGDPVAASYDGIGLRRTCHLQRGTKTLSWDVHDPRPEDKALVVDTGKRDSASLSGAAASAGT